MVLTMKQECWLYINNIKMEIQNKYIPVSSRDFLCFLIPWNDKSLRIYISFVIFDVRKIRASSKALGLLHLESFWDESLIKIITAGSPLLHIIIHVHCFKIFLFLLNTHTHTYFAKVSSLGDDCSLVNTSKHCRVVLSYR